MALSSSVDDGILNTLHQQASVHSGAADSGRHLAGRWMHATAKFWLRGSRALHALTTSVRCAVCGFCDHAADWLHAAAVQNAASQGQNQPGGFSMGMKSSGVSKPRPGCCREPHSASAPVARPCCIGHDYVIEFQLFHPAGPRYARVHFPATHAQSTLPIHRRRTSTACSARCWPGGASPVAAVEQTSQPAGDPTTNRVIQMLSSGGPGPPAGRAGAVRDAGVSATGIGVGGGIQFALVVFSKTTNSSPPAAQRFSAFTPPRWPSTRRPTCCGRASPTSWPRVSFRVLKLSRSIDGSAPRPVDPGTDVQALFDLLRGRSPAGRQGQRGGRRRCSIPCSACFWADICASRAAGPGRRTPSLNTRIQLMATPMLPALAVRSANLDKIAVLLVGLHGLAVLLPVGFCQVQCLQFPQCFTRRGRGW